MHRDLKPANLFLERSRGSETLKVLDFGIAKVIGDAQATALTRTGLLIGSAPYMSPEQAQDPRRIDPRSDVYAMGATLFELLTGRLSVEGTTSVEIVVRIAKGEVLRHPRELRQQVPAWLDEIAAKALTTDPAARFQSALEMKRALEQGLRSATLPGAAQEPVAMSAPRPAPVSPRPELDATDVAAMSPTGARVGPTRPATEQPVSRPAPTAAPVELPAALPSPRSPVRFAVLGAVVLGVAAAVVVMWPDQPDVIVETTAPPPPTTVVRGPEPTTPVPTPTPPSTPPAEVDAGAHVVTPAPTPPRPAPTKTVRTGRPAPHRETDVPAGAAPEPSPPPEAPPVAGPDEADEPLFPGRDQGLPDMPDNIEVIRLLFNVRPEVNRCAPGQMVVTDFRVAGASGRARDIRLQRFTGTQEQERCVRQVIRRISFPRFRQLVFPIQHIFPP